MIKLITVTNYLGESIEIDPRNPEKSGFLVKNITGLGPVKGTVNVTEVSSSDGGAYNSARITTRNIVLDLRFTWAPDIETVRLLSYKYFPVKKPITLMIQTDKRTATIDGYVESNQPNIFSKAEGTQISIVCPFPYFSALSDEKDSNLSIGEAEPLFEFEWDPDVIEGSSDGNVESGYYFSIEHDDPEEFSFIASNMRIKANYDGDEDTGFNIVLRASGPVTNPVVYNAVTDEAMRFNLTLDTNEELHISTVKRKKKVEKQFADGLKVNVLNNLDRDATWLTLSKGANYIAYTAASGREKLIMSLSFDTLYEGL